MSLGIASAAAAHAPFTAPAARVPHSDRRRKAWRGHGAGSFGTGPQPSQALGTNRAARIAPERSFHPPRWVS